MKLQEVLDFYNFKFKRQLAKEIGLTNEAIYEWSRNDVIPWKWQKHFEEKTKGQLRIDPGMVEPNKGGRPQKSLST